MSRKLKIISLCLFVVFICQKTEAQSVQFNSLSLRDGLSQATVTCFDQDRAGFMWIGTRDGLNRYDGYRFAAFRSILGDSASISNNNITAITHDMNNNIWVGTAFGLNRLDAHTLEFESYYHWFEDSLSLSSNRIRCLAEDSQGRMWIGTDNGVNRLNPEIDMFERFSITESDSNSLSNNVVNNILIDSKKRVWIGTEGGLNLYNDGKFKRYRTKFEDGNSLSDNNVLSMVEDGDGNIWIGTRNGLNKFNPDLEVFTRYFKDLPKRGLLSSNIINALVMDVKGDLWVGTPSGLNRFYADIDQTTLYRSGSAVAKTLPNDHILSLFTDYSDMVWIGTQSAGIATLNLEAPQFNSFIFEDSETYDPSINQIYAFCQLDSTALCVGTARGIKAFDMKSGAQSNLQNIPKALQDISAIVRSIRIMPDSAFWVGTDGMGLIYIDMKSDSTRSFLSDPNDSTSLSSNKINEILSDENGNLWLATSGGGLSYYNRSTNTFVNRKFDGTDPNSLRDNNIMALAFTADGNLWIASGNAGVYMLDIASDRLIRYPVGKPGSNLPLSNTINDLFVDKADRLWVATSGGGISVKNPGSKSFTSYTKADGLANDVALSIIGDDAGTVWISTNSGLSAFNTLTKTFRNYSDEDVLGKNTFNAASCFKNSDGYIFFGGANGFDYFNSQGLKENNYLPQVYITGFQLIDQRENTDDPRKTLLTRKNIDLDFNHTGFSIEFAALNFKQSGKNQYAYRLKGLFEQWRYIGTRHFATFSNLNPGKYTFEVIGSNNDGLWNDEPARIRITVRPAYWQTAWFQVLSALAVLGILYLFYRYKLASEKARSMILEEAVDSRTKEISKERDTNAILLKEVHHRVKNNLQIIVSLLNLQSRFINDTKLLNTFSEIQNRVRSMSLIHQKMYQTKDLKTVNIEEYVSDLAESLLRTYQIGHQVELDVQVYVNSFKSDTLTPLGLIINEIISNSLKYAFEEGRKGSLFVRLSKLDDVKFRMVIGDDGIGLPTDKALSDSESFGTELITALTEQLNGTIQVLSKEKGTVYQIDFEDAGD